jgi:hypothetical protein
LRGLVHLAMRDIVTVLIIGRLIHLAMRDIVSVLLIGRLVHLAMRDIVSVLLIGRLVHLTIRDIVRALIAVCYLSGITKKAVRRNPAGRLYFHSFMRRISAQLDWSARGYVRQRRWR